MRTACVTGATGLLGSNLVRELAARGVSVRAPVRDVPRAHRLLAGMAGVDILPGDLGDVAAWASHLEEVDVVFHAAAYFRESYRGGYRTNRQGYWRGCNCDG